MKSWFLRLLFMMFMLLVGIFLGIDTMEREGKGAVKIVVSDPATGSKVDDKANLPYYVTRIEQGKMVLAQNTLYTPTPATDVPPISTEETPTNKPSIKEIKQSPDMVRDGSLSHIGNRLGNMVTRWSRIILEKIFSYFLK